MRLSWAILASTTLACSGGQTYDDGSDGLKTRPAADPPPVVDAGAPRPPAAEPGAPPAAAGSETGSGIDGGEGTKPAQPDDSQPDSVQPNSVQPDSVQPDSVQPDSVQPDSIQPDSIQPDSIQPDSVQPDAGALPDAEATPAAPSLNCDDIHDAAASGMAAAYDAIDTTCELDEDCATTWTPEISCALNPVAVCGMTIAMSNDALQTLQDELSLLEASECPRFEEQGCLLDMPTIDCRENTEVYAARCIEQRCTAAQLPREGARSCDEISRSATDAVAAAYSAVDTSCTLDEDCVTTLRLGVGCGLPSSACSGSETIAMTVDSLASLNESLDATRQLECVEFDGCPNLVFTNACNEDPNTYEARCVEQQCAAIALPTE